MQVLILGVGDAFTRMHYGSSALIRTGDAYTLLDCPDLIHRVLLEADQKAGWGVAALDIHDCLLTHLHGDHCNGLESFAFSHRIHRRKRPDAPRPRLYASEPSAARVWERLAPAMDSPMGNTTPSSIDDYFDLRVLSPDQPATVNGITVECRFTSHPIPTIGFKLHNAGTTLGWSGDTPFEQAHIDWLCDSDLIVHECNRGPAHTKIEELNALPDDVRRKMALIHLPDNFDPSSTDIRILSEGEILTL